MDTSLTGESMCGVEQHRAALRRERQEFNNRLADFPHSFQLENSDSLTQEALRSTKKHLEAALTAYTSLEGEDPDKRTLEIATTHNLLAFVLFRLDQQEEASKHLDTALSLQGQSDNIVSLANKAVILWHREQKREADALVQRLLDLKKKFHFRYLMLKAKAELASSYLRFGRQYVKFSVDGFKEVTEADPPVGEPERSMWKFGLAVAYRQSIDLQSLPYLKGQTEASVREEALKLLLEVVDTSESRNIKANACAEIGLLIHVGAWDEETRQKLCSVANTSSIQSIKKALSLDRNDPSVLLKAGRLFRYQKDLQASMKNLRNAIKKQESSSGYHHLALTFKAMATNKKHGKAATKRGGRRNQRKKNKKMARRREAQESQPETMDTTPTSDNENPVDIATVANGNGNEQEGVTSETGKGNRKPDYSETPALDSGFCSKDASLESFEENPRSVSSSWPEAQSSDEPTEWYDEEVETRLENEVVIDDHELNKETAADRDDTTTSRGVKSLRRLLRAIKSPPSKKMTRLDNENPLVVEAIEFFKKAIDFSEGENSRATYDLGLLFKACRMNDEALECFRHIYMKGGSVTSFRCSVGPLDVIGAFEQSGFILLEQSELTDDETEKQNKLKDAENMLKSALVAATSYYSRLPLVESDIQRAWRCSIACLLKLVDEDNTKNLTQKLKDKIKVLMMVKNLEQTQSLVQKLELSAQKNNDAEELMLCVESYDKMEKYEAAIHIMDMMSIRPPGRRFQEINIKAAKQKLMENSIEALAVARYHFDAAFRETFAQSDATGTSGTDSMSSDDETVQDHWDMVLLHDEEAKDATVTLCKVLEEVCPLNVTIMEEDVPPGKITSDEVTRIITRSKMVIVVLSSGRKPDALLRTYFSVAAKRSHAYVLTLNDSCHICKSLKPLEAQEKVLRFPAPLLDVVQCKAAAFNKERASAIAELFFSITVRGRWR